jgi:hypothetical protein
VAVGVLVKVGVADAVTVDIVVAVKVGVRVGVGVLVDVGEAVGALVGGLGILVDVDTEGTLAGVGYVTVGVAGTNRVGTTNVILGMVIVGTLLTGVEVGTFSVAVTGRRGSAVMVGTGVKSATCRVARRSCALPVAGISMMICWRISSSMGGIVAI